MEDEYYKAMALADGELDSDDLPELVHKLARDSALMRAAQSFLDLRRNRLARVYARTRDEPVPQSLIDTLMTAPTGSSARGPAGVFAYGGAMFERLRQKYRMPGWSLAAGPAFAATVAIAVYSLLAPAGGLEPAPSPQVEAALERVAGDKDPSVPGLKIGVTYLSDQGAWCRQYDTVSGSQQTSALACRHPNGGWKVVVQMPPSEVAVRPAGPLAGFLGDYVRAHTGAAPLTSSEQQSVVASGWQRPAGR